LKPGALLGKTFRFQLKEKIRDGTNSEVWLAHDLKYRRAVIALKIVHRDIAEQKGAGSALQKASLRIVPLSHPNLARIHSFEKDGPFLFFVVEHVKGPALSELLKKRGKITDEEILWVAREVCSGLRYLHKLSLCHGNLDLENLMLTQEPPNDTLPTIPTSRSHPHQCIRICDAVVSRVMEDIRLRRSRTSPIQWKIREDMRCLAILLYQLLTGEEGSAPETPGKIPESVPPLLGKVLTGSLENHNTTEERNWAEDLIALMEAGISPQSSF
jgi:serine/threonine-protein kinase